MGSKIATLTLNPSLDKSTAVNSVASEIKLRCDAPSIDPGGGGINVARAIFKLGGEATAVYSSGGPNGTLLGDLLDAEGIPQERVNVSGMTRESFTVYERSTGLQYRFGMPGTDMSEAEWTACLDALFALEVTYIVFSGSLPPGVPEDIYAQGVRRAQAAGLKAIVDTSGPALQAVAGSGVFMVKPNLRELEMMSGHQFQGESDLRRSAPGIVRDGLAEVLVISMGASGALMVTADEVVSLRPPAVPIQSKVGAGDSMVGGMTLALAQDKPLRDAVRYGIAAGSAAVMTPGTQLCRKEDADDIYEQTIVQSY